MRQDYRLWLEQQKYATTTITAQLHRVQRVEQFYGNLDDHFATDRMASVVQPLLYSTDDERQNRPNPSKIPFDGTIRTNLASYRSAVERYRKFLEAQGDQPVVAVSEEAAFDATAVEGEGGQRFGLERDMQAALRLSIEQLEAGLTIVDDGAERSVESGFIDITARDGAGITVVIELKAGPVGQRAVAQILSYMGDVAAEQEDRKVRGILVGSTFDKKAIAAASMVPHLLLRKY